ncbi:uncharacterized protein I206_104870 [Kwoniella pini CBS 10737]|uniref:Uncharacterized protein n=1 Tax=Kwoniella pini CBS 10737 TaxID=1296096 RepID=A0A1B9I834_9TREE|nr:uncharacterized protein I206_02410 [Kwoniella pini CBS 10737]OCF51695.1 hypothetical protein I206_02410 [Kwoniella pini CBS 10737]
MSDKITQPNNTAGLDGICRWDSNVNLTSDKLTLDAGFQLLGPEDRWPDDNKSAMTDALYTALDVIAHSTLTEWATRHDLSSISNNPVAWKSRQDEWKDGVTAVLDDAIHYLDDCYSYQIGKQNCQIHLNESQNSRRIKLSSSDEPRFTFVDLERIYRLGKRLENGNFEEDWDLMQEAYNLKLKRLGRSEDQQHDGPDSFDNYCLSSKLCNRVLSDLHLSQTAYEEDSIEDLVIPMQSLGLHQTDPRPLPSPLRIKHLSDWQFRIDSTQHSSGSCRKYNPRTCDEWNIMRAVKGAVEASAVIRRFQAGYNEDLDQISLGTDDFQEYPVKTTDIAKILRRLTSLNATFKQDGIHYQYFQKQNNRTLKLIDELDDQMQGCSMPNGTTSYPTYGSIVKTSKILPNSSTLRTKQDFTNLMKTLAKTKGSFESRCPPDPDVKNRSEGINDIAQYVSDYYPKLERHPDTGQEVGHRDDSDYLDLNVLLCSDIIEEIDSDLRTRQLATGFHSWRESRIASDPQSAQPSKRRRHK